jgi:DNA-binding response OmpR family regulator
MARLFHLLVRRAIPAMSPVNDFSVPKAIFLVDSDLGALPFAHPEVVDSSTNLPGTREPMQSPVPSLRVVHVGAFELDIRTGELTGDGRKVQLAVQPLQVFLALLEHPGELVTREQLVARLWPSGTFVDFDHSLNKAVNKLREVLGDSPEDPPSSKPCRGEAIG